MEFRVSADGDHPSKPLNSAHSDNRIGDAVSDRRARVQARVGDGDPIHI
jgi:hypothetical protein